MKKIDKRVTFKFFNYKWRKVPGWAAATEGMYRKWYLTRYGYGTMKGLAAFLADKKSVCEAGCGLARDSKMFAEANPNADILAVDQSAEAIAVAKRTLKSFPRCRTAIMDITAFDAKRKFDFISCDQVMHHTPDPGATLKRLFAALNPGGVLNFCVCRKKNAYRDLADDLIMDKAASMEPDELWAFAETVTKFAKALYDLDIRNVKSEGRTYDTLQRFVHDNLFRAWYNPAIPFKLSVSSNYDWFSNNPRFSADEVRTRILGAISGHEILRFHEDDAVISVSLRKAA